MTNDLTVRVSTDHEHDEHAETRTLLVVDAEPDDPLLAVSVTFDRGQLGDADNDVIKAAAAAFDRLLRTVRDTDAQ